ncbi:hypothetical protein KQI38_21570 [Tissierella carlieri]|uniref:Uncharacterized protein n=1 Tax=Tissierella carlieri TaxID=689904 RepID=A0ABT1SAZ1_9FIRM|nr:hypothetical protein [Tissierella carlieri]MBU5314618.1 hypothetical protein [Tissierella carlieri]MCQ4923631.1 hypothetical protein [Tissierella carlieri]
MKNIKNIKWREVTFNALIVLVLLLLISNLFFYRKFKEMDRNSNYVFNISRAITIAANENFTEALTLKLLPEDLDYLIDKFEKIKPEIGTTYNMKSYIAIEYKNGSTLMVKVTRNKEGEFLIQDMFLLNEDIYDKLKYDINYSNL